MNNLQTNIGGTSNVYNESSRLTLTQSTDLLAVAITLALIGLFLIRKESFQDLYALFGREKKLGKHAPESQA